MQNERESSDSDTPREPDNELVRKMENAKLLEPEFTDDLIKKSTSRKEVLAGYSARMIQDMHANLSLLEIVSSDVLEEVEFRKTEKSSVYPLVQITAENAIGIDVLTKYPGESIEGKFLLCRTIVPACLCKGIETVVEDLEGQMAIRLALINYSPTPNIISSTTIDPVIPSGFILAIKNPKFTKVFTWKLACLIVDNPSQVELLSKKTFDRLFPNSEWRGILHASKSNAESVISFWDVPAKSEAKIFNELKQFGNKAFGEKRFTDAIRIYNLAIEYSCGEKNLVDILSNRAAAFLNIRCFHRAQEDTKKALEIKPDHIKAVYRHTKALIGLKLYKRAHIFLARKVSSSRVINNNKDIQELYLTTEEILSDLSKPKVEINIMKLLLQPDYLPKPGSIDWFFEYTGPLKTDSLPKNGKSRGVFATEAISPGQLLLVAKPFCSVKEMPDDGNDFSYINNKTRENLVIQIANKIYFEPESGPEFYNLFAGENLGSYLEPDSVESQLVSINRIDQIVLFNSFVSWHEKFKDSTKPASTGIWIAASYFNHSCAESNAGWIVDNNVMVVRATAKIEKGQEILLSYIDQDLPYNKRLNYFQQRSFECSCKLCEFDKMEHNLNPKLLRIRSKMLKRLHNVVRGMAWSSAGLAEARIIVQKLMNERPEAPLLNLSLASETLVSFQARLCVLGQFQECLKLAEQIYKIRKHVGSAQAICVQSLMILRCYVGLNDIANIRKWRTITRKDFFIAYGSAAPSFFYDRELLGDMESRGMPLYEDDEVFCTN